MVGIDIEEVVYKPLHDFESQFTRKEWSQIENNQSDMRLFYSCWNKKESLVKATGEGLSTDLSLIDTLNDQIVWHNKEWHWQQVPLHPDYTAYLACNKPYTALHIKQCLVE